VRVGIYDHFGWAVAVTCTEDGSVVDRRRLELVEAGVLNAPIHHPGEAKTVEEVSALVDRVLASSRRATGEALRSLGNVGPIASLSLRVCAPGFPTEIADQLRPPYEARADAIRYRRVLAEVAGGFGWKVWEYDAKRVEAEAAAWLGNRAEEVLYGPKKRLGPPWTKDHRIALAAALLAKF